MVGSCSCCVVEVERATVPLSDYITWPLVPQSRDLAADYPGAYSIAKHSTMLPYTILVLKTNLTEQSLYYYILSAAMYLAKCLHLNKSLSVPHK